MNTEQYHRNYERKFEMNVGDICDFLLFYVLSLFGEAQEVCLRISDIK